MTEASANTIVTEGEPLAILCAAEGMPAWTFSPWSHTGPYIGTRQIGKETSDSTIWYTEEHVNYTHTGMYTCMVRNREVPHQQRDISVTVRFPPKSLSHRIEGEVIFTETRKKLQLELTVFAHPEQVNFTWFTQSRNSSSQVKITEDDERFQITLDSDKLVSTLIILNVSMEELTNYTARTENGVLGGSQFKFIVRPQGCPWKVSVDSTNRTAASLSVTWRPGFDGGLLQTIIVKLCNITTNSSRQCKHGEEKDKHVGPEYDVPLVTDLLGLSDNTCYRVVIEAHNEYNENNGGKGCTKSIIIEGRDVCTKVKPTVPEGEFTVVYMANTALLTWSRPSNANYDRQVVEQWQVTSRQRRQVETCDTSHLCNSSLVPVKHTSLTVLIDRKQEYRFRLVLYDGHVQVFFLVASQVGWPVSEKCQNPDYTSTITGAFLGGTVFGAFVLLIIFLFILHQKRLLSILFERRQKAGKYRKEKATSKMYEDMQDPSDETSCREPEASYSELGTNRNQHEYASLGGKVNARDTKGTKQSHKMREEDIKENRLYNSISEQKVDHDNKEYNELSFACNEHPYMDLSKNGKTIESRT